MITEGVPNPRSTEPKQIKDEEGTMAQRNQAIWVVTDKKMGIRALIWIPQQGLINETDLPITKAN